MVTCIRRPTICFTICFTISSCLRLVRTLLGTRNHTFSADVRAIFLGRSGAAATPPRLGRGMSNGFRILGDFEPFGALWLSDDSEASIGDAKARFAPGLSGSASGGKEGGDDDARYVLFPSQRGAQGAEEEIYIRGNRLVWSCAQTVVKSFTMSSRVVAALWCAFPGDADKAGVSKNKTSWSSNQTAGISASPPSLCILTESELHIYGADGSSFTVSLPFVAVDMWAMGDLVLIRSSEVHSGAGSQPSLFTLSHPLDEPRPVLTPPGKADAVGESRGFKPVGADEQLSIQVDPLTGVMHAPGLGIKMVANGAEPELSGMSCRRPLCVGFDEASGRHCVYDVHLHPISAANSSSGGALGGGGSRDCREEGDATAFVYSEAHGWCACGSIGLGAVPKKDWFQSRGDATMHPTWAGGPTSESSRIFLASSLSAQDGCMCAFVGSSHLDLFSVKTGQGPTLLEPISGGRITCVDACPIVDYSAIDPCTCIATISSSGTLCIYMGTSLLCQVPLPGPSRCLASHPTCGRINIGGGSEAPIRVEMTTAASLITRRALSQVRNNTSCSTYLRVRRALLGQLVDDNPGLEWDPLAGVIASLVQDAGLPVFFPASLSDRASSSPSSSSHQAPASGGSAWDQLLSSKHHISFVGGAKAPPPALLASCLPTLALPAHEAPHASNVGGEPWEVSADEREEQVERLLRALHCLYEDVKLTVSMHDALAPLARLLLLIALALDASSYADHYLRHHPELAPLAAASNGRATKRSGVCKEERVPDVYRWLGERVEGTFPPMDELEDPSGRVLPLTGHICTLFVCLSGDVADDEWAMSPSKGFLMTSPAARAGSGGGGTSKRLSPVPNLLTSAQLMRQQSGMTTVSSSSASDAPPREFGRRRHGVETMSRQSSMAEDGVMSGGVAINPCEAVVESMVSLGLQLQDVDSLPIGVAMPIREALWSCRANPPQKWGPAHFELVGRADLSTPVGPRAIRVSGAVADSEGEDMLDPAFARGVAAGEGGAGRGGGGAAAGGSAVTGGERGGSGSGDGSNIDGTRMDGEFDRLRFGRDRRLIEVRRCLSASLPVKLRIPPSSEVTDHDVHAAHQARLQLLARRTLSIAVGRGIFTLATATPLPTEALPIPPLQLGGRLPSNDAFIKLDLAQLPLDHAAWPEFHNGVAAALRLALGQTAISRTWIVYNKPESASYAHAGVLMGLGLQGHLKALAKTDLYSYLCLDHEATQIGIMLGMAASKRATMEQEVFKMLYVHIPTLHPPNYPDLEVSSVVQTAAVMGIGLLYQGSKHRRICEVLLSEIGRRASNDRLQDREGYSLAAGLALGLVTLGQGNDAPGLADLQIENKLRHYIKGGRDVTLTDQAAPDPTVCCRIKEGDNVNVDVTAPGATLALGLMFMRTNSKSVAARLDVPDTNFTLQYVRPDHVLLRMLARSLIMWDEIEPTKEWVESRMPAIVRNAPVKKQGNAAAASAAAASSSSSGGGRSGGGGGETGGSAQDGGGGGGGGGGSLFTDQDTLRHLNANIVAGCCMAVGLRYAGSGEKRAMEMLMGYLQHFAHIRKNCCDGSRKVDRQLMENCIGVLAIAASLVMAGTGNVDLLRVLRKLRERVEPELNYGHHMAIGMAIGFLFMGGGRATLCTTNEAIAALVIALYPRFPNSTTDCRYHLQAFRHLFVLAVEQRCLEAIEVGTSMPCMVPIEITLKEDALHSETTIRRVTPCLLPELNIVKRVRVCSPRHWPVTWEVAANKQLTKSLRKGCVVHVQRKIGHLGYAMDPSGLRNLLVRSFPRRASGAHNMQSKAELVQAFSGDPEVLSFAKYMCTPQPVETEGSAHAADADEQADFTEFCTGVLYECLTSDKPEMLAVYTALYNAAREFESSATWCNVMDLRLIMGYYGLLSPRPRQASGSAAVVKDPLISDAFLTKLQSQIDLTLRSHALGRDLGPLSAYAATGTFPTQAAEARNLAALLLLHSVPSPLRLGRACRELADIGKAMPGGGQMLRSSGAALGGMVMRDVPPATAVLVSPHVANAAASMV